MKIAVVGYSGSGKSTLSRKLAQKYGVDVLHLDTVHWLPGWQMRTREQKDAIVGEFLDTHDGWVIDGTYSKQHFERRMREADKIIFMNFNRLACLCRVVKRYMTYRGKTREDMGEGCPEKLDFDFAMWVLFKGRTRQVKERYKQMIKKYDDKVVILKNQSQIDSFEREYNL